MPLDIWQWLFFTFRFRSFDLGLGQHWKIAAYKRQSSRGLGLLTDAFGIRCLPGGWNHIMRLGWLFFRRTKTRFGRIFSDQFRFARNLLSHGGGHRGGRNYLIPLLVDFLGALLR